ncbi:MAG: hypothetical protein IKG87_13905 [Clostridia bacterium]|nr:hypothetical protein [Clostridia bacterium]MBR4576681.1 hypothetical protein [Clostridia bacterium]
MSWIAPAIAENAGKLGVACGMKDPRDVDLLISGEDGNLFFRGKQLLHARYVSSELVAKVYGMTAGRDDIAILCTGPDDFSVSEEHYRRFVECHGG